MTCDCKSYNQPEITGPVEEVILDPRPLFAFATKTVCVDACISDQILNLWKAGVFTRSCCCGHGKRPPEVFIDSPDDARTAHDVLSNDSRLWRVMFWAGERT